MKTGKTLRNFLLVLAAGALFSPSPSGCFRRAHMWPSRVEGRLHYRRCALGLDYVGEV
ncbi:MAG: hypothetical protein ACLUEK_10655 [Oscillospiraceae bacterium]